MSQSDQPDDSFTPPVRGRGAPTNPAGRFETRRHAWDAEAFNALYEAGEEAGERQIPTRVFPDATRSIVSSNDSPDLSMDTTLNPYRGCEHGCIYCYARPTHEYLGDSAGLDFETKIYVKENAAALLRETLSAKSWQPRAIGLSGITDPYQPLERKLRITRACLEVLDGFGNPAFIITKNHLVLRDIDLLARMAERQLIAVHLSITTLDAQLARRMEPRAARPDKRLEAIETLSQHGIPVGVMIGPVLPGLTDHEVPAILEAAAQAGARSSGYTLLRLPYGVKELFVEWLEEHYPERKDKVLNRIRDTRGGKLYDSSFGERMRGSGLHAEQIAQLFQLYSKKFGLTRRIPLSTEHFRRGGDQGQMDLF